MPASPLAAALRRHATTVALVALAAGALVVVLVVDRGAVSTGEATARKRDLFEAWRGDDLTEVRLAAQGHTAVLRRAPRDDAGQRSWQVDLDGAAYPAEEQAVDQYLGTLEFATPDRRVSPASVDRHAMQLDAPRAELTVAMGPQRYRLLLGGPAPTPAGAAYVEVEGRGVFVVTAELAAALDARPETFRSRSFVPYFASDLAALTLDGKGGLRPLTRARWGDSRRSGFRFDGSTPEGHVRVSPPALEKIWVALGQLQAEAFLADADADRALAREVTLTLVPRDPGQQRGVVELGGPCPDKPDDVVAIRRTPTRASACVPRAALEALEQPAEALVDHRLLGAPLDEITEVKLQHGDHLVDLARSGSAWHLRHPTDREVDPTLGKALLETLLDVEATTLTEGGDPKALGLDPPVATVRVISLLSQAREGADAGGDERVEELSIGAEKDGVVHVRRAEDGAVAAVPAARARALLPTELALRNRRIFDEPLKSVRALRVERAGQPTQRFERTDAGTFRLLEPRGEGLVADNGLATEVADALVGLTAERWITDHDDGTFGLDHPRLVIEADLGDKGAPLRRTLHLELGAPGPDGSFARVQGDPAIFLAPRPLEQAADRWLLDRNPMLVEPADVARVTLTAPGAKRLVVEQVAGAFRVAGGPADPASSTRAAAVRDAVGDLIAEGVVSLGKPERRQGLDRPSLEIVIERSGPGDRGKPVRVRVGASDAWRGLSVSYARCEGVDATYALAQAKLRPFLDALGVSENP